MSKKTRKNLIWEIDLLESQLNKDPRLYQTKYALEKKKTHQNGEANKQDIESRVLELKYQLISQKTHHGIVTLVRGFKQAIKVESLKMKKRIKQSSASDNNKQTSLKQELEELNKFSPTDLAELTAYRTIRKAYMGTKRQQENPPDFLSTNVIRQVDESSKFDFNQQQNNVYARLLRSTVISKCNSNLISSINNAAGKTAKNDIKNSETEKEKTMRGNYDRDENDFHVNRKESEKDYYSDSNSQEIKFSSGGEDEKNKENAHPLTRASEDSSESEESDISDEEESAFNLPTLATGYISRSDDEDMIDDKVVREITTMRKNRRGQRARRAIWEMKYGNNAKHLQKEQREREILAQRKAERAQQRAEKQQSQQRMHLRKDDQPLHPSWEAKKKLSAVPVKFQGQKIKF